MEPTAIPTLNPTSQPTYAPFTVAYLDSSFRLLGFHPKVFTNDMETVIKATLVRVLNVVDTTSQIQNVEAIAVSGKTRRLNSKRNEVVEKKQSENGRVKRKVREARNKHEGEREDVVYHKRRTLSLDAINITTPAASDESGTAPYPSVVSGENITLSWRTVPGSPCSSVAIYLYQFDISAEVRVGQSTEVESSYSTSTHTNYQYNTASNEAGVYYQLAVQCSLAKYDYSQPFFIEPVPTGAPTLFPTDLPTIQPTGSPVPSILPTPQPTVALATDIYFELEVKLAGTLPRADVSGRRLDATFNGTATELAERGSGVESGDNA